MLYTFFCLIKYMQEIIIMSCVKKRKNYFAIFVCSLSVFMESIIFGSLKSCETAVNGGM